MKEGKSVFSFEQWETMRYQLQWSQSPQAVEIEKFKFNHELFLISIKKITSSSKVIVVSNASLSSLFPLSQKLFLLGLKDDELSVIKS